MTEQIKEKGQAVLKSISKDFFKGFLHGLGSVADLYTPRKYVHPKTVTESLRADWCTVGDDLRSVIDKTERYMKRKSNGR